MAKAPFSFGDLQAREEPCEQMVLRETQHPLFSPIHFSPVFECLRNAHQTRLILSFFWGKDWKYLRLLEAGASRRMRSSQITAEIHLVAHPVGFSTLHPYWVLDLSDPFGLKMR